MFLEVKALLTPPEVERLRAIAGEAKFVDGRISNPANQTKVNLQADMQTPLAAEASQIVLAALARSREFRDFAFPKMVAPPMLTRYEPNMKYGAHYDAAYFGAANGQSLRSDLSATVFLNPPESYQGGELVVHQGASTSRFKLNPGDAIFYPSTTLHEVAPVTTGERLVAITFIQSLMPDEAQRNMLYDLNEVAALEGLKMSWENRMRLEGVRANLLRRWSRP
ncbi:MAG: Fe2+-dependent dioxygenase [Hyphomonadaceae bacterium]|mgnify:CR=1 FL=1|nr:Fe2+-dependent dioxygenase [Hyphomonadaceae bacterium]MBX3509590.1 Fe2+-dependent dioxygenase [Hyphomonadaceae bacterium]